MQASFQIFELRNFFLPALVLKIQFLDDDLRDTFFLWWSFFLGPPWIRLDRPLLCVAVGLHSPRDWALLLVVEFHLPRGWAPLVVVELFHLPPTLLQGHPDVARALLHRNRADANHEVTSTKASVLPLGKGACHIQVEAPLFEHEVRPDPWSEDIARNLFLLGCVRWPRDTSNHPVSLHLTL